MNEENIETTRQLPGATPFEQRVLAEFAALRQEVGTLRQEVSAINTKVTTLDARLTTLEEKVDVRFNKLETRLTTLEDKVDARLRETRPIWEGMRTMLEEINSQMRLLVADMFNMRARVFDLESRQRPH